MKDLIIGLMSGIIPPAIIGIITWAFKMHKKRYDEIHLEIMRVHILTLISDFPDSHEEIMDLFREYEKRGGNGSTKLRVDTWRKKEGLD